MASTVAKPSYFSGLIKIDCLSCHGRHKPLFTALISLTASWRTIGSERLPICVLPLRARRSLLLRLTAIRAKHELIRNYACNKYCLPRKVFVQTNVLGRQWFIKKCSCLICCHSLTRVLHVFFTWSTSAYIKKPFAVRHRCVFVSVPGALFDNFLS